MGGGKGGREGGNAYLDKTTHMDVSPMPEEQVVLALQKRPGEFKHFLLVVHKLTGEEKEGGRKGGREGGNA